MRLLLTPIITLFFAAAAIAGEARVPTTQPSKPLEGYRFLDHGSWVITEARIRSNGTPATIKRKAVVTTLPTTGQRGLEESRWHLDSFEPLGPVVPLAQADRRGFDDLGLKPDGEQPDQAIVVARKRYLCAVSTYVFQSPTDGRTTRLTLWRDKSGETQLPQRMMSINNKEIPLPADALQADFTVEGDNIHTQGQRRIVSLATSLRVNGQAIPCLVESTRSQGTSNNKPVTLAVREWFCHELPGERMRMTTSMSVGSMQVESEVSVIDFHVARLNADAGSGAPDTSRVAAD